MVDTCLCMGAGITVAQGLQRMEPETIHFAFIGDSTFFHTGIPGVINAVYNRSDIIIVILDNSTTAMTGNQPHPGTGVTMMGNSVKKLDIEKIFKSFDVDAIVKINPFDQRAAQEAVKALVDKKGVRVIIFEAPCIVVAKPEAKTVFNSDKCTGCRVCLTKMGCPAISLDNMDEQKRERIKINESLCAGCGLCAGLCPAGAIKNG